MITNLTEVSKECKDIKYQLKYSITKKEARELFKLNKEIFYVSSDDTEFIVESLERIDKINLMDSDLYIKKYYI